MTTDKNKDARPLKLRVLSPVGRVVDAEVESVVLPGLHGDFAILPDHHDTVAQLRPGIGTYAADKEHRYLTVFGGVATVHDDEIEVFSPVCEPAETIDEARAQDAQERATQRLAKKDEEGIDVERAQAALYRALLRLEAAELSRQK